MNLSTRYKIVEEDKHLNTAVSKLMVGTRLPFDVFTKENNVTKHLFNKGTIYSHDARDILIEKGITEFYIHETDAPELDSYISKGSKKVVESDEDIMLFREYTFEKELYYQINKNLLFSGEQIYFNLYRLRKFNFSILAEASEKEPAVTSESFLTVEDDILIKKTDIPLYNNYLKAIANKLSCGSDGKTNIKSQLMRENAKFLVKDLLDNPRSGETIKKLQDTVCTMIDTILKSRDTIFDLFDMSSKDYYTYTHSVDVAVMSIGLSAMIGLIREETEELGIGALLHDVGKSMVPPEILNKQGRLNLTEHEIIKTHVVEGEKILLQHSNFPKSAFPSVTQHHEKLTGRGYPAGLSGGSIKLFGRITAIADCYDALTTNRPYKAAYTPYYALLTMVKEKKDYDCHILKEFVEMLGKVK
ncbi:MAG: HD-GYP domain-containing protein [Nitrospirae bacterium]|nr:HD-GYP domain-containing protein [Nitrospirota bacterium]